MSLEKKKFLSFILLNFFITASSILSDLIFAIKNL